MTFYQAEHFSWGKSNVKDVRSQNDQMEQESTCAVETLPDGVETDCEQTLGPKCAVQFQFVVTLIAFHSWSFQSFSS